MRRMIVLAIGLCTTAFAACESPEPPEAESSAMNEATKSAGTTGSEEPADDRSPFAGELDRDTILDGDEDWGARYDDVEVDEEIAEQLASVDPGASIEVYLGVWCSDSLREVPRFWRALDVAGNAPFDVNHIGLDTEFSAGDVSLEGLDIEAVPTFIVYRDGKEVGRVVENSPENIETHLLALLTGEASGVISASR